MLRITTLTFGTLVFVLLDSSVPIRIDRTREGFSETLLELVCSKLVRVSVHGGKRQAHGELKQLRNPLLAVFNVDAELTEVSWARLDLYVIAHDAHGWSVFVEGDRRLPPG